MKQREHAERAQGVAGNSEWQWLVSLVDREPGSSSGSTMLAASDGRSTNQTGEAGEGAEGDEDMQYFPGQGVTSTGPLEDLCAQVTSVSKYRLYPYASALLTVTVPLDVLLTSLQTFVSDGGNLWLLINQFDVIHPIWPILHVPSFYSVRRFRIPLSTPTKTTGAFPMARSRIRRVGRGDVHARISLFCRPQHAK